MLKFFPNSDRVEVLCRVKGRKRNTDGSLIGNYNSNPILDNRIFTLEYHDGRIDAFATNVIENRSMHKSMIKVLLPVSWMK